MSHTRRWLFIGVLLLGLTAVLSVQRAAFAQNEPYRNPDLPVEERVEDLLARMTLDEKIGQMTLIEKNSLSPDDVTRLFIGGVLSGGGGDPNPNTPEAWAEMVRGFQEGALATRLGIPVIYGADAVHGHNNVYGAVIFPHNVGLGATRNPELVQQVGQITAQEMIATGIYWDYAPVIAVVQDIRWGRTYEAYSENTDVVTELGVAFLHGLQGDGLGTPGSVLATPKHYIGDGGTEWNTSPFGENHNDRGVTIGDEAFLREVFLPPYIAVVNAGAMNIMASYSSWGGLHMHEQHYLLTDVLEGELGFQGFIVSDWSGMDVNDTNYYQAMVEGINAGIDMNMVPYDEVRFIAAMQRAAGTGDIPMERIDDAVRRILRVKFEMGLFENPFNDPALLADVGSDEHRAVAREAVAQSLVLLKNEGEALPIADTTPTIFIGGAADDIGIQSGGWTIEWQGRTGDITPGTTILEAVRNAASAETRIEYDRNGGFETYTDANGNPLIADVGIAVVGELPYAEYEGDDGSLALSRGDLALIERMRASSRTLIIIILSGRPIIITDQLVAADAVVAAWLPGTEGDGIADVLFGDHPFTGTLSYTWPRTVDQLPFDFANLPTDGCDAPLFPFGYGLTYDNADSSWLDLAVQCAPPPVVVTPTEIPAVAVPDASAAALAPDGTPGETYIAPFPVHITLDGQFADWSGIPTVALSSAAGSASLTFAAAADDEYLYLWGNVADEVIVSGEHGADYWNEDSIEFYINATGDASLTAYAPGVVQITLPALNADTPPDQAVIAGVQGATANAQVVTVHTATGYAVEVAVPLHQEIWDVTPADGGTIGFQVHLNASAGSGRDTKLIWSVFDTADQSYLNPSVFGQLEFHAVEAQ